MSGQQSFTLREIAEHLGATLIGDESVLIRQVGTLGAAKAGEIAFLVNPKYRRELQATAASAVIVPPKFADLTHLPRIVHPNAYACYARVVALLNPVRPGFSGIHPTAVVDSQVPSSVSIGANAVVGANVILGDNVLIYPGCVIGDKVRIGEGSVIYPNVTIYDQCIIGFRAVIQSGAVIGSDGFGFAKEGDQWVKIRQIGRVVIGDDVEIGANTSVDRGAIGDTVIGNGVKLDNQIQVAHNVIIGENSAMAGCVGIAGSTTIGRRCMIGGAGMISGHLEIGDDIQISGGTLVAKNLKKPGVYTGVFPLDDHSDWLKNAVQVKHLQRLADKVAELEQKLEQMEKVR